LHRVLHLAPELGAIGISQHPDLIPRCMKRLSDFKPLGLVELPDIGTVSCLGLTLIVGPNSAGKTRLLNDLNSRLCGDPRSTVVARRIELNKPEYQPLIDCLRDEGYIRTPSDANGRLQLVVNTPYLGTGEVQPPVAIDQVRGWYDAYPNWEGTSSDRANEFLLRIGRLLVTKLSLERRLTGLGTVGVINFETAPPQTELHSLRVNDNACSELAAETVRTFGKAVWPDHAGGDSLSLRVADGDIPPADDRLSFVKMSSYRRIEDEGDGLKSYVSICIALLLGLRPVCLIDEPEMCLHPPQAYSLGRFIGRHAASKESATFVATHSAQILRGVLQSTRDLEIIRLSRTGEQFHAHRVSADKLALALAKPTLRAETILDGIFAEAIVIVEADGDRLVYHTTWETLAQELRLDVHFAAVGGISGVADACQLYRTLHIPVVVIADLDLLRDFPQLCRILEVMAGPDEVRQAVTQARGVMKQVRGLHPTIDPAAYKTRLADIDALTTDWQAEDDRAIRRKLSSLSNDLGRMRRLKTGIRSFPLNISEPLAALVETLKKLGLFLVPVGELEQWLTPEQVATSRGNKAAWASDAAEYIQTVGAAADGIWKFVRDVGHQLDQRRRTDP
jgi:hypothetical protein